MIITRYNRIHTDLKTKWKWSAVLKSPWKHHLSWKTLENWPYTHVPWKVLELRVFSLSRLFKIPRKSQKKFLYCVSIIFIEDLEDYQFDHCKVLDFVLASPIWTLCQQAIYFQSFLPLQQINCPCHFKGGGSI